MRPISITRRTLLGAAAAMVPVAHLWAAPLPSNATRRLADIEHRIGGRLGVAAIEAASGRRIDYRSDERFSLCSTFKFLLAAAILNRTDEQRDALDRLIPYGEEDLLDYAPITREHVQEGGLTLGALCAAAIQYSDNTAANLLLRTIGGPAGITRYARSIGDRVTRLDRNEPSLNEASPGDDRDTTSPRAMVGDLKALLLGHALSIPARRQLETWLIGTKTGAERLRAGLPTDWRLGDKTGSGDHGTANDIAILRPPGRSPILVAAYLTETDSLAAERNAALADIGRFIAGAFQETS
jgi:beta-lactamase class A